MDFSEIRRTVIVAMFSDDVLMELVVLKGGNALNIVHRLGGRTSIDVDFSIQGDFPDLEDAATRIRRALTDRFDSAGYVLFDFTFEPRPRENISGRDDRWGGYRIEFKLLPSARSNVAITNLALARRSALEVAPGSARVFRVEISKHEYCDPKVLADIDGYHVYVYPTFLLAAEKLRALCQQMPEYAGRRKVTPRARDFYDIHAIISDTADHEIQRLPTVIPEVFAAKDVSLDLLMLLRNTREFHRSDWPSVTNAVSVTIEEFDFYFDFVVEQAETLRSLLG